MSTVISEEDIFQFENMIYLPMVLTVFQKDGKQFKDGAFKLKGPYLQIVEKAGTLVESDLWNTQAYIRERKLKIELQKRDDHGSEYMFYHDGYTDIRRYLNIRLRNRTEELIRDYLQQASQVELD